MAESAEEECVEEKGEYLAEAEFSLDYDASDFGGYVCIDYGAVEIEKQWEAEKASGAADGWTFSVKAHFLQEKGIELTLTAEGAGSKRRLAKASSNTGNDDFGKAWEKLVPAAAEKGVRLARRL